MNKQEKEEIIAGFNKEEREKYQALVKREKELNERFRNAKTKYHMMDIHKSRMRLHDGIKILLWIGAWVYWKLCFLDISKTGGMGHRWARLGGTLYVVVLLIPLTVKGIQALIELLQNCNLPYFRKKAEEEGYQSLSIQEEEREDTMFSLSDELGQVQFQIEKMLEGKKCRNEENDVSDFLP